MKKYDIYMIWCKDANGDILKYYGCTANLIKRKSEHRRNYERWVKAGRPNNDKRCSSVYILDNDWKIEKINEIVGERWEAKLKEGEYIKNNDCVNVKIASRTYKEYCQDNKNRIAINRKKYYNDNKQAISEKRKEYHQENKDKLIEKANQWNNQNKDKKIIINKKYRLKHKDEIAEKRKENYNLNKDKILEKKKEKITCECGVELRKSDLARHHKTKKHINFINSANND